MIAQGQFPNTLQWNLSIVDEFNFMSTWTARECAASLAFELGHPGSYPAKTGRSRSPKTVRVGFRDEVRVFLQDADTLKMRSFSFSEPCLANWHAKPWAKRPTERSTHAQSMPFWQTFLYEVDLVPPIMSCKIIDNHGRPDGFPADGSDHGFPGRDGQGQPPPRIPDFTDNNIAALGQTLTPFGGQPGNFLEIRTWFVDHISTTATLGILHGVIDQDQATWIQQLREGWNDVLVPDIPTAYQIVHPQPARGHADMWVTLDIILSQNIHIRRYSGLITVASLDDLEGILSLVLSAVDAVDLHHLCSPISSRRCSITHGWTSGPVNAQGRHLMRSGHAFQIFVPADSQQDPDHLVEVPDPAAVDEEHAEFGSDVTMQEDEEETPPGEHFPQDDGPEDHDPGTPDSSSSELPRDILTLLNCYIYRLNHPPLHLFLNYVSGVPLLIELAHVLRVPRESFVASYPVWVRMVGQAQEDWSIIVQHLDDIPAASTERLVILDVEVHFPHMAGRVPAFPATIRRVLRVPPLLTRQDVLRYAGVYQYCVVQHDSCLVYFNNEGWPILRPGPRQVQHGTYLRANVPPASDGTLNTLQAIRQVETYVAGLLESTGPAAPLPAPAPAPTPSPANTGVGSTPPCVSLHSYEIWHRELREAFDAHSHIENEDEGPALYADVWFIDNVNYKTCRHPVKIKLLEDDTMWFFQIMECWIHQMQASIPVRLHVVQPLPPATTLQSFTLHILIEQNVMEARAAAVVSMHIQERLEDKLALLRLGVFSCTVRTLGRQRRCAHPVHHHPSLQGRDESGKFKTSIAKVYPPQLHALMADAIAHHALLLADALPVVEPLAPSLLELNRLDFVTDQVQPDYYGL